MLYLPSSKQGTDRVAAKLVNLVSPFSDKELDIPSGVVGKRGGGWQSGTKQRINLEPKCNLSAGHKHGSNLNSVAPLQCHV